MSKKNARSLDEIAAAIHAAERANVFVVADLLHEARESCDHGFWGHWLEEEFEWSEDTAERYIKVSELATKFRNLRNLKLAKTTLYALTEEKDEALQGAMIEALAERASKTWLKAADAKKVVELERLRHQHGDLPDATLWALDDLSWEPWANAAIAALKEARPIT